MALGLRTKRKGRLKRKITMAAKKTAKKTAKKVAKKVAKKNQIPLAILKKRLARLSKVVAARS